MEARPLNARAETLINMSASKNTPKPEDLNAQAQAGPDTINDKLSKPAETITLSGESLKLASTDVIQKPGIGQPIQDEAHAKQILSTLMTNLNNNPQQALAAQGDILSGTVKALLA